jgi:hypothetical protein
MKNIGVSYKDKHALDYHLSAVLKSRYSPRSPGFTHSVTIEGYAVSYERGLAFEPMSFCVSVGVHEVIFFKAASVCEFYQALRDHRILSRAAWVRTVAG